MACTTSLVLFIGVRLFVLVCVCVCIFVCMDACTNSPNARVIFAICRVFAFVTSVARAVLSFSHTVLALSIGHRHKFSHVFQFAFLYHAQTRSPASSHSLSLSLFLSINSLSFPFLHFINGFVTRIQQHAGNRLIESVHNACAVFRARVSVKNSRAHTHTLTPRGPMAIHVPLKRAKLK